MLITWANPRTRLLLFHSHGLTTGPVWTGHRGNAKNPSLTDNGKIQVDLLARHFRDHAVRFTYVFSSDLDRASETAQGICQQQLGARILAPFQTALLKEQAFGALESTRWQSGSPASATASPDALRGGEPTYTQEESMASMKSRANSFLNDHILPLMRDKSASEEVIAVVAHGIILQVVWSCLTELFDPRDIHFGPGVQQEDLGAYVQPTWSNSGYMELDIKPLPPAPPLMRNPIRVVPYPGAVQTSIKTPGSVPLAGWSMSVMTVDNTSHLAGAQQVPQSGGTVRNAVHGSRQQTMDDFCRLTGAA